MYTPADTKHKRKEIGRNRKNGSWLTVTGEMAAWLFEHLHSRNYFILIFDF